MSYFLNITSPALLVLCNRQAPVCVGVNASKLIRVAQFDAVKKPRYYSKFVVHCRPRLAVFSHQCSR